MARDSWAYRDVAVESVIDPRSGQLQIRPMAGQAFAPSLPVHCSRRLTDLARYRAGTRFLLSAKLTDRLGGPQFLYAYHGDPVIVLSTAEAKLFLAAFRRGRI
ncbi:hypothetical protein [Massilia psychrophila]|jgi:hypothetical protein|uniref:Uncharacterized protein n=1 Tax=Massilia psychrophila TaxID=1603353 RepID=A0A2G8SY20_9BURK|nr:hypothetical protein [Massilia psychrophila]PIL38685.1 hypothetical protein CR103_16775 [Massilia psychrophila]GGE81355.1 hypothetical protein GCM10008020_27760 [Massilia psychrophila]